MEKGNLVFIKESIKDYCSKNIKVFHHKRLKKLEEIKLTDILKRKNPYLYRAKGIEDSSEIVRSLVRDFLSSHEETLFGNWLEELALFVCNLCFGGKKSSTEGIDLEFEREGIKYFVSIKSGPNWGNNSQIKRMVDNFKSIKKRLPQNTNVEFVEGCCYGRCGIKNKGFYVKYCGKDFWELISGIDTLYIDIVEPIGNAARVNDETYSKEYQKLLNRLSYDFTTKFCEKDGSIKWELLIKLSSLKDFKLGHND